MTRPKKIFHISCAYDRGYRMIENGISIGVTSSDGKTTMVKKIRVIQYD